jgi:hypothetical protein
MLLTMDSFLILFRTGGDLGQHELASTKPKILFCDIYLSPGEQRSFLYEETLPKNSPSTYHGDSLSKTFFSSSLTDKSSNLIDCLMFEVGGKHYVLGANSQNLLFIFCLRGVLRTLHREPPKYGWTSHFIANLRGKISYQISSMTKEKKFYNINTWSSRPVYSPHRCCHSASQLCHRNP